MKRFQECSWYVKLWRYRWYLLIPLKWIYFRIKTIFSGKDWDGSLIWDLLTGEMQFKMNWFYTHEEVIEKHKDWKNGKGDI